MPMALRDFDFDLPDELIARYPTSVRSDSRLLHLAAGVVHHRVFRDLPDLLQPGDLLVRNNSRVIPARLFGAKASGGRVELLVERLLDACRALVHMRASKAPRVGTKVQVFGANGVCEVVERRGALFVVEWKGQESLREVLDHAGHMPLPPYLGRADEPLDRERYQTVYATREGSVAAPTAGLHFDEALLDQLQHQGVEVGEVTLHVGAGTFQPPRAEQLRDGRLHAERIEVTPKLCTQVEAARARGGRVVAVGTTSVRALETAAQAGRLQPLRGETELLISPGFRFQVVDALITNFHLPGSSLLMLVAALVGRDELLGVYRTAVQHRYRFFSYGDAMLVMPESATRKPAHA